MNKQLLVSITLQEFGLTNFAIIPGKLEGGRWEEERAGGSISTESARNSVAMACASVWSEALENTIQEIIASKKSTT